MRTPTNPTSLNLKFQTKKMKIKFNSRKKATLVSLLLVGLTTEAWSSCDCGSIDVDNPCTGQSITVTVKAGTPNGGTAIDNVYKWTFNSEGGDARCGQFANGDYWIAPNEGKNSVTVKEISSPSHSRYITADANPTTESTGLMTGANNYGNYNSENNILPKLPISYTSTTSILAAIQRNESTEGNCGTSAIKGECIDSYNVVTILPEVPEKAGAETIRPNITGETKEILTFDDFDFTRLPSKDYFDGYSEETLEEIRKKWSHSTEIFGLYNVACPPLGYCSEGGRAFRSHALIDDYGGGVAVNWYNDLMVLFSDDYVLSKKQRAIAAMLSYGLDLYHAMYDAPNGVTRRWGSGATQHPGKFMPPVFLAALLKDHSKGDMLKTAAQHIHDAVDSGPLELAQIHSSVNGPIWGDIPALAGVNFLGSYWANLMKSQCYDGATGVCNPAIGAKNMYDPHGYIDGPPNKPGTSYFSSSLGVQRSMVATMFLMREVCNIINYDNLVQYVDRTISHGVQTGNDPCVTPDSREDFAKCDPYRNTGCLYYGVTWGPTNPADPRSQCISKPTPPYTKTGRFSSLNGAAVGTVYTSGQIEKNWKKIRGVSGSCRAPLGVRVLLQ